MTSITPVSDLARSAGLAPWATYPAWADLAHLADTVALTVVDPIRRAAFVAQAAADLAGIAPDQIPASQDLSWEIEAAEAARPTPAGSTELWGSAVQGRASH